MTNRGTGTREDWLAERRGLFKEEKELTRCSEAGDFRAGTLRGEG
jgi:predicted dithiol-disulfide oxidoreductase (DUF899 family)